MNDHSVLRVLHPQITDIAMAILVIAAFMSGVEGIAEVPAADIGV